MGALMIKKHTSTNDDKDYDFLRKEGVEYIKQMAGNIWTDHNLHDPGITFLEVLCYAITDLGYRIDAPLVDLLAREDGDASKLTQTFPTAKKILTTKPISENDYRKLFIDIEGVKNAFMKPYVGPPVYMHCSQLAEVTPDDKKGILSYEQDIVNYRNHYPLHLKGLNTIFFVPEDDINQIDDPEVKKLAIDAINKEITDKYHANRNLCEDLVTVEVADEYEIKVCGDIELEKTADVNEVVAEILFRIQQYLSPSVKRHSLAQLLDQDKTPEEIFNGPVLNNGFIKDEDLAKANFKTDIRLSDLIQIISEVEGVTRIKKVLMKPMIADLNHPANMDVKSIDTWKICMDETFTSVLDLRIDKSIINVFKDIIPIDVDQEKVEVLFLEKIKSFNLENTLPYEDFEIPKGSFMDAGAYYSIQNDLPNVYGVDEIGLPSGLTTDRYGKALQLKGYLSFFDQVLATYFSHLQHVGDLLSLDVSAANSYYGNDLSDIKNFKEAIVKTGVDIETLTQKHLNELDDYVDRKGAFLDHLLARFAENMNDYVFLMIDLFGEETKDSSLIHKSKLLEVYEDLSYERACAFNYFDSSMGIWDTYNVSGLQHRIARLLGIRDYSRRNLTSFNYEIYQENDDDDIVEYRWRIKNEDSIMFSSSMHYHTEAEAEDELWKTISLAWDENNYDLLPTEDGEQWYFNLIDKVGEVVARHIQYFSDKSVAEQMIKDYAKFIFDNVTDEGMYLFENILLRPDIDDPDATNKFMHICVDDECMQCNPNDPYSFRLTIVFPGNTKRFSNIYFRTFAERIIREEVPAHILTRICWIGNTQSTEGEDPSQMELLEELYYNWLEAKMENPTDQTTNTFLKPLVKLLHELDTIYPSGTLHNCKENENGTPIILNQSSLGSIKNIENGDA